MRQLIIVPLELDGSEVNDLRRVKAAQGYAELGMYDEADEEIAKISPNCRIFRLFLCSQLGAMTD